MFIEVILLGPRLNLHRHVPLETVDSEAAKRSVANSLKNACEADGKTLRGMPSGVSGYICPSDMASQLTPPRCRSAPGPVAVILGSSFDCPSWGRYDGLYTDVFELEDIHGRA